MRDKNAKKNSKPFSFKFCWTSCILLMYQLGVYLNVPLIEKYYLISFTALIAYLIFEDYKGIKNYLKYQ
ncbi:hypothetical protein [Caloranaerobacter sp. DY30410]|uniref:hypothetical protein n=1 Tax=Caloranaerobacter sp. DY30410 TaxID=3238305 RepID=UPI003D08624C